MSLRLSLSVAAPYEFVSRYDSAIDMGPTPEPGEAPTRADGESDESFQRRADEWAAPVKAWLKPLRVARETGDYAAILKPGGTPTRIKLRQVTASMWARLDGYTDRLNETRAQQLIFRAGVMGVTGDVPAEIYGVMAPAKDPEFPDLGDIMSPAFVDAFTGQERVIFEVASHLLEVRRKPPGN